MRFLQKFDDRFSPPPKVQRIPTEKQQRKKEPLGTVAVTLMLLVLRFHRVDFIVARDFLPMLRQARTEIEGVVSD